MRGRREKVVSSRERGESSKGSADRVPSFVLLMSSVNTTAAAAAAKDDVENRCQIWQLNKNSANSEMNSVI